MINHQMPNKIKGLNSRIVTGLIRDVIFQILAWLKKTVDWQAFPPDIDIAVYI